MGMNDTPNIVVATDLSEGAVPAARWAATVAAAMGGHVVVAHIVEISLKSWLGARYDILVDAEKRAALEGKVRDWYQQATGEAPAAVDVRVNTCFNGLSEAVSAHGASLLVMAPTGKGAIARVVVGSRVQDLASRPPCPLVVVASAERPKRVAVATDFSPAAGQAITAAAGLAHRVGAELFVTHVAEVPDLPAFEEDLFADSFEAFFQEATESLKTATEGVGVTAQQVVLKGRAEVALDDFAQQHSIDLLVLGQTGHDSVLGDLLGSVPRSLIGRMPCSILVVPTGAEK
jgi:nucleotide-binding universal stress UspA family protein